MLTVEQIAGIIAYEDSINDAAQKIYDLCKPDHSIDVAAAALENEVTSVLLDMTVATVLGTLIEQEGGGRTNFVISPQLMSLAMDSWDYTVTHDGLIRTISIISKHPEDFEEADGDELAKGQLLKGFMSHEHDAGWTKPQAGEHVYDRPLWAVRFTLDDEPCLRQCVDRADAERVLRTKLRDEPTAHIENRYCLHVECPASGCNADTA